MSRVASMTGFARAEGIAGPITWAWEIRSVNGRGLELRFRLPAGHDSLEPGLREAAGRVLKRGNVTANLAARREETARLSVDRAALDQALQLALHLHARIPGSAPPRAEALLALPGVLRNGAPAEETPPDLAPLRDGFERALAGLLESRHAEGARLATILAGLVDEIAALHAQAAAEAAAQPEAQRARLAESVRALLRDQAGMVPEERLAQEVALMAARADVREELDRLGSHIAAARALLAEGANVGRRFDFLAQEFNREVNTLCSKSATAALTAVGLRLKAAVEQLREQVQNVE